LRDGFRKSKREHEPTSSHGLSLVAAAGGRSHNAGMKAWLPLSLAVLAGAVGAVGLASTGQAAPTPPKLQTVSLHRCTDARGTVTWQDDTCPAGSKDELREMAKPVDAPPRAQAPDGTPVAVFAEHAHPAPAPRQLVPPPAMYSCTSYDGNQRYSESYDPNPRCEPMVIYYPYPNQLTPEQALSCRWVEDSCVRLSDREACAQWRVRQKEATSLAQRAFSDTIEFRRSDLRRINQIIDDSCP
jgi:hypothetical protein